MPLAPRPPKGMSPAAPVVGRLKLTTPARMRRMKRSQFFGSSLTSPADRPYRVALAAAIGRELSLGQLGVLMLESEHGKVLMLSLRTELEPFLLMAACDHRSVIGNVLWSAKECGRNVLAELDGS